MSLSSKKCCVPSCVESGDMQKPLHLFPNPEKDKQLFNKWVCSIGGDIIGLDNDDIYKHRRVCHAHFEDKFCCRYKKLSNVAIPTLNLPGPTSLPKFTFVERRALRQMQHDMSRNLPSTSRVPDTDAHATTSTDALNKENIRPCLLPRFTYTDKRRLRQVHQGVSNLPESKDSSDLEICMNTPASTSAAPPIVENIDSINIVQDVPTEETKSASGSKVDAKVYDKNTKKKTSAVFSKTKQYTALERRLYNTLRKIKNKLSKTRSRAKKNRQSLIEAKKLASNTEFKNMINNLPRMAKLITMMQFREMKKREKGRRFSVEEKIIALSILKQSPKCYRFLRKIFILPAAQTLSKLINKANVKPGINKKLFVQLKKATETMKVEDRLCIVLFDEMALKANISYNERKDKVTGFVTDGQITKPEYADHAQVFMIRGLMKNYKQPISYTFSAGATNGTELAKQLKEVIVELQEAGFVVVATVSDQGTNNRSAIKLLLQETRGVYLRNSQEPKQNIFVVNQQEIVHIYDPPHLLKCIRNNLLTKNLEYVTMDKQKQTATWQHLELLLKENPGYRGIRLMPKLTDNHVIPSKISKMKVKYATQVFSQSVASNMGYLADKGILPQECKETADVLLFFDNLFDSVNGSYSKKEKHGKPLLGPVRPKSVHHQLWNESKKTLKKMKFINQATGKHETVPTIENWVWTLDSIEILLKKLKDEYDITSVWMRHLNQDPIENFFGAIRCQGCRNTNPSTERFETAYTSLLINNMSSVHAPSANCESDYCKVLHNLIVEEDSQVPQTTIDLDKSIADLHVTDLSEKDDPRIMSALQFVSGYFVRCAKKKVFKSCIECNSDLVASQQNEYLKRREYAGRHWLVSPSKSLLSCISGVQDITNEILKKKLHTNNLKELIKTLIFSFIDFDFLNCKQHKNEIIAYVINLSCRFFIYNYCKDINKILIGKRDSNDDEDGFQIKAKKYFKKCAKRRRQ